MSYLSIAIVTPAVLLASVALSDFAGAADLRSQPPGSKPPPSSMIFQPTVERHRKPMGFRRPSIDRPRPMDREQTTGRRPSTVRRQGFMHHFIQNPVCRRAPTPDLQPRCGRD